ncbi:TonB-dependent receptor, partial [Dysgonomonas sp. OttesenSCG-928-M03]|nr:TonB-dependent receptor [Dysgonomonas sp. OttesenSCG-928-M03]
MHKTTRIAFLLFIFCLCILKGYAQKNTITLKVKSATLKDIVKQLEKQSDYNFVFNENLDMEQRKSISISGMSISGSLANIFSGTGISWQIMNNHIVLNKAKKITISGYVTNYNSMETLLGATITDLRAGQGSFTNSYGYYSIQTISDSVYLQASYIGFKPHLKKIFAKNDTIINFRLHESDALLQDVMVYNTKSFSPSGSSVELSDIGVRPVPAAFSENDVLKSLQTIPGIKAGVEGTAGMYIRGGSPDQNLILIDGVPVYNTGHIWGLFSVFNGDAVKKVSLHKGSFPARFSGRLSSIIDIRLKDGDMQKYHADITVGTLAARLNAQGPIIKGKTSFSFSARRSYIDGLLRIMRETSDDPTIPVVYLYDMNAKINHKFSDRS